MKTVIRNIEENLTIPQNKDDKIEVELYKKLDNNYDHSDRIVRWYRNAKKSGVEEAELKKTFVDNIEKIKKLKKNNENEKHLLKSLTTNESIDNLIFYWAKLINEKWEMY